MCGIAGFINFEKERNLGRLANIIQKHRGPDAQGIWEDDWITLANQRLAIIDPEERSNQPFKKNGLIITYNGAIYNFKELKESMISQGVSFSTESDTEVILELFRLNREKCLDHLVGMFAFAIYDIEKQELFIARDHFGIKPIFYTQINEKFAFASELKTLTEINEFNREINWKSLVAALNYSWIPGNETMFKDCFKLPPAHYLKMDRNNKPEVTKYWELNGTATTEAESVLQKNLDDEINSSIKRHLVADVPVSSFLSGGLDSSLISVLAKKEINSLSTYTISFASSDQKVEQMPEDNLYARQLADEYGLDHHEIKIKADIIHNLPLMVRHLDEPIGDPAAINTYLICKAAHEKGVKVLLSGMGADEIFFGYRRQKATLIALQFQKIPAIIRSFIKNATKIIPVKVGGRGLKIPRWSKRFLDFAELDLPDAYRRSYSYYSNEDMNDLLLKDCSGELKMIEEEHNKIFNQKYEKDPINQMCHTDLHMFMNGLNLTYTDRASMASSVEVRVPFIDRKIIDLAMQIPGKLKFRNNKSKFILKKIAENYIPWKIVHRSKASFGAPIRSWISNDLKSMVDNLLSHENVQKRGIFNYEFIKKMIEDDRTGKSDNAYQIYQLLTIELWFREFVD